MIDSKFEFTWDTYIKSFECKESMIEFSDQHLTDEVRISILKQDPKLISFCDKLYDSRYAQIIRNFKMLNSTPTVVFHNRYGWVLSVNDLEFHLGKSNFYNNIKMNLGHTSYLSGFNTLVGPGVLSIGNFTSISQNFTVNCKNLNHPTSQPLSMGPAINYRFKNDITYEFHKDQNFDVTIMNDVWIGRDVKIHPGSIINNGCIIAEDSIVKGTCEPFGIYAGKIAKLKRLRFSEKIVEALLKSEWWDIEVSKLNHQNVFFNTDFNQIDEKAALDLIDSIRS